MESIISTLSLALFFSLVVSWGYYASVSWRYYVAREPEEASKYDRYTLALVWTLARTVVVMGVLLFPISFIEPLYGRIIAGYVGLGFFWFEIIRLKKLI